MARESELEMLFADLARLPWWVSVAVAVVVYVAVAEVLPRTMGDSTMFGPFVDIVSKFAVPIAALFLIPAGASALRSRRSRRLLAASRSIDQIRDLGWEEFEELMEAYYEREGYDVVREGGSGPDGGVDLRLRKGGETVLVQCKQWRTRRVGPKVVRELQGVVSAEQADGGVVVAAGSFTTEAERFARDVPIELVDGAAADDDQSCRCRQGGGGVGDRGHGDGQAARERRGGEAHRCRRGSCGDRRDDRGVGDGLRRRRRRHRRSDRGGRGGGSDRGHGQGGGRQGVTGPLPVSAHVRRDDVDGAPSCSA